MDERNSAANGGISRRVAARVIMVVAALGLVASFALPWGSADDEFRKAAAALPEVPFYEPTGMTVADATDLSLLEYARAYGSLSTESEPWMVYTVIMFAAAGTSVLALVLAALGKPIGAAVFALLTLGVSRLLVWDFVDRGVLPNSTHGWGIAPTVYLVSAIVLIAAAIWMVVLNRREKATARDGLGDA